MAIKTKELLQVSNQLNESIPDTWTTIPIKDFGEIVNGGAFKSKLFNKTKGIRLVRIRDLTQKIMPTLYDGEYDKKYLINSGDFLVSMDGDFIGTEWVSGKALLNQRVCKITVNNDKIHSKFFRLGINMYLEKIHSATSYLTVAHLSSDTICHIEFPIPPLNEQKRIVAKIEELFSLIDFTVQLFFNLSAMLSNYKQTLLNTSFKINSLNMSLDKCGKIGTGGTPSRKKSEYYGNKISWVKTAEVKNNIIYDTGEKITQLGLDSSNATIYPKNSVILAMYGEGKTRGRCAILGIPASTNQACAVIVCDTEILYYKYCFYWLQSKYYQIRAKSSGGNQPNLNLGIIKKLEITLPDISQQKEIVKRIELGLSQLDFLTQNINKALSDLQKLKRSILKQAFEGKLVPQDPNDEPAKILLEKIKQEKQKIISKSKRGKEK